MDNDTTSTAAQQPDALMLTAPFHIDEHGNSPTVRDGRFATATGITRTFRAGQVITEPAYIAELLAHGAPVRRYRRITDG